MLKTIIKPFTLFKSLNFKRTFANVLKKHETWRDEHDTDNVPKVKRRDGTIGNIDKSRGFVDYDRIAEPYRDP